MNRDALKAKPFGRDFYIFRDDLEPLLVAMVEQDFIKDKALLGQVEAYLENKTQDINDCHWRNALLPVLVDFTNQEEVDALKLNYQELNAGQISDCRACIINGRQDVDLGKAYMMAFLYGVRSPDWSSMFSLSDFDEVTNIQSSILNPVAEKVIAISGFDLTGNSEKK